MKHYSRITILEEGHVKNLCDYLEHISPDPQKIRFSYTPYSGDSFIIASE